VRSALDIQAMAKTNNFLTLETRDSKPYVAFRGVPIRICDQILNNEATRDLRRNRTCSSTNRTVSADAGDSPTAIGSTASTNIIDLGVARDIGGAVTDQLMLCARW